MKKLSELLVALDLPYRIEGKDMMIERICYDSRKVEKNSLFVAIKGFKSDGHDYIKQAISKGASAVVIEHDMDIEVTKLITSDTRRALAELSYAYYGSEYNSFDICGISGTNGKTTMTHLLYQLSKADNKRPAVVGTLGVKTPFFHIEGERTTPESSDLAKTFYELDKQEIQSVFMEVSSHALVLKRVHGLRFDIAAFSNLTQDHLDFHKNMNDYFKAKSQLFYQLKHCGKAVINIDDHYGKKLYSSLEVGKISYAVDNGDADFYFKELSLGVKGVKGKLRTPGCDIIIKAPLLGKFNAENIAGALAIYKTLYPNSKLNFDNFAFEAIPGRMESFFTSKATLV
ncbi:MAG: UDP-N-acetylmuramoyl-L-alanyl-D-glutamate--2,6-diaminopimelate ligase, partial [Candidatus Neomarinimicrobiota bacterium]